MAEIKTALISVSNKHGLVEFVRGLQKLGVGIISTGGTANALVGAGIRVRKVEEVTGFPEVLNGRVKTLHPHIHAGILALRSNREHMETLRKHGITPIDMVVVNLYPFRETIAEKGVRLEHAVENIDIGGPSMIRAAAKNYDGCAVVVKPEQYKAVLEEMGKNGNKLSDETREKLALEAFEHTAAYDAAIQKFLGEKFGRGVLGDEMVLALQKVQECRYGENPHQKAAFYMEHGLAGVADAELLNGKEMSFNNINDLNAALECVLEFKTPAAVVLKHANPCGVATAGSISDAFRNALECDPVSAFGGVIALNRKCDAATAKQITSFFNEVVAAPAYDDEALAELKKKQNLRVLKVPWLEKGTPAEERSKQQDMKRVLGGMLVQEPDLAAVSEKDLKVVSKKKPTKEQVESLLFAWKVVKHVKSNAIVCAKGTQTVGIGAGQMSRVDSMELALKESGDKAKGAVIASDAFFPFRDCVDLAANAGVSAAIETGGSVKDEEVIAAADEHGIALVFTGQRHFRH